MLLCINLQDTLISFLVLSVSAIGNKAANYRPHAFQHISVLTNLGTWFCMGESKQINIFNLQYMSDIIILIIHERNYTISWTPCLLP